MLKINTNGKEGECDFDPTTVCNCGICDDKFHHKCQGKEYHTHLKVTCPMHALVYEIECHRRASMAEDLIHPLLKTGHSNAVEASHNVLIRFQPKHIFLKRLHYLHYLHFCRLMQRTTLTPLGQSIVGKQS